MVHLPSIVGLENELLERVADGRTYNGDKQDESETTQGQKSPDEQAVAPTRPTEAAAGQARPTSTVEEDYGKAVRRYGRNPIEEVDLSIGFAILLFVSLLLPLVLAAFDGFIFLRALTWWELIALLNTFIFSILFFIDLWQEARTEKAVRGVQLLPLVGAAGVFNFIFILGAGVFAVLCDLSRHEGPDQSRACWHYWLYLSGVLLSFSIFSALDFLFAHISTRFTKVREYWAFFVFVDFPAAFAFVFLWIYLLVTSVSGRVLNREVLSGAVVMQMLRSTFAIKLPA